MKIRNKEQEEEYNKLKKRCDILYNNIILIDLSNVELNKLEEYIDSSRLMYIVSRMIDEGYSYFEALNILTRR